MQTHFRHLLCTTLFIIFTLPAIAQFQVSGLVGRLVTTAISANGSTLFAGTTSNGTFPGGVYRSTDNGSSWLAANSGFVDFNNFPVVPDIFRIASNGAIIFVATSNNGLFKSVDNGDNWIRISPERVYQIMFSGSLVFLGTWDHGIYRSSDNGNSWTEVNNGLGSFQGCNSNCTIGALTTSGGTIFASRMNSGVYKSTDGGNNWIESNSGLWANGGPIYVSSFCVNGATILAGTNAYGIYRSQNNGNSWTSVISNGHTSHNEIRSIQVNNNNILASTAFITYFSTDNGDSWSKPMYSPGNFYEETPTRYITFVGDYIFAARDQVGVGKLPYTIVTSPVNNSQNQNVTLTISSRTISGASSYTTELNTMADLTGISFTKSGANSQTFSGLSYSTDYYARVKTDLSPSFGLVTKFTTCSPEYISYITSPANGAVNTNVNLTVTSNTVIGASTYTIELNTSPDFTGTSIIKLGSKSQNFTNLSYSTTYYTRVKTELSPNWGNTKTFTTGTAQALSFITSPSNNSTNQLWSLNLLSNIITAANSYVIQLSPTSDFSSDVIQNSSPTNSAPFSSLAYNTKYYARVSSDLTPGLWGPTRTFTTGYPSNFSYITSPASNAVNVARVTNLASSIVKDATLYTIEANTAPDFTGISIINSSASNIISFSLDYETTYFVRVKTNLVSEWGPSRSFTTVPAINNTYVVTPANNAVNQLPTLNVTSNEIYGANVYTIQLATASDFSSGVIELSGTSKTISFSGLSYNTIYYSRVSTNRSPGIWGASRSFKTIDHYMTSPGNGTTNINWVTNIVTNTITGTSTYTIEANTLPDFSGTSIVKSGSSATQAFTLTYDQTYYIRANSNLATGWGTVARSFTTGNPVSFAYVTSPANGATGITTSVNVTSNAVSGATSYTIELNTLSDFSGTAITKTSSSRTINFTALIANTMYYSRVLTNLASGQWGVTKSFYTGNPGGRTSSDVLLNKENEKEESVFTVITTNPFSEILSFTVQGNKGQDASYELIDMKGTVIYHGQAKMNSQTFLENNLNAGLYLLKVTATEGISTLRLIRE